MMIFGCLSFRKYFPLHLFFFFRAKIYCCHLESVHLGYSRLFHILNKLVYSSTHAFILSTVGYLYSGQENHAGGL